MRFILHTPGWVGVGGGGRGCDAVRCGHDQARGKGGAMSRACKLTTAQIALLLQRGVLGRFLFIAPSSHPHRSWTRLATDAPLRRASSAFLRARPSLLLRPQMTSAVPRVPPAVQRAARPLPWCNFPQVPHHGVTEVEGGCPEGALRLKVRSALELVCERA